MELCKGKSEKNTFQETAGGGEAKAISSPWNFLRARKAALRLMALGNSRRRKKPVQPAKVSDEKVFDYAGNL